MKWYKLNEDIKNKSITVERKEGEITKYTFLTPLQLIENQVSIEPNFLNKVENKASKNEPNIFTQPNIFNAKITFSNGLEGVNQKIKIQHLSLGFGGSAKILPDEGQNKILSFKENNLKFFALDFSNEIKLTNLPNPIEAQEAATKNYVDIIKENANNSINELTNQINTKLNVETYNQDKASFATQNQLQFKKNNLNFVNWEEQLTGDTFNGKPIYACWVGVGNLNTNETIASSGTLITNVDTFLGVESGVITRYIDDTRVQLMNINAYNNLPDRHSSLIYTDKRHPNQIMYWFYNSATQNECVNRPFLAKVLYTKI